MQNADPATVIGYYAEHETPTVIILDTPSAGQDLIDELDQLAEVCDPGTNVLVIGQANDVLLYRELIQRGVSDYLLKPVDARQVFDAVSTIVVNPDAPPSGRLIAFMSSRGGAGSSTLSHNAAWELGQAYQEEVVLMDLDITFGTAGLAFNMEVGQGIHTALSDPDRLDDVLLDRFLVEYDDYVRLLTSPAALDAEEKMYTEALDRLFDLVRRRASFVVLDVPHRWAPWTQQLLVDADETVIVGTMDLASLRDTKNIVDRLNQQRGETSPVRMVLNHAGAYKKTELTAKDFESAVEFKPTVVVPHDPNIFGTASNNGQMVGEVNKRHKVSETIRQLAMVIGGREPVEEKAGLLSRFRMPKLKEKATAKDDA